MYFWKITNSYLLEVEVVLLVEVTLFILFVLYGIYLLTLKGISDLVD